ncbi:MAG TPA: NAD(P)-dependent oxidoreductase, partial [Actinomycetota bacterium]|nr:NAD(P)-dependent oxidoreductase [Actinomycetota bacterium]
SGYRTRELLASEATPTHPGSAYGRTSVACEQLLTQAARDRFPFLLVRLPTVYGATGERPHVIRNFARKARTGQPVTIHRFRNGIPGLDLLHIDDVRSAVVAAVTAGTTGLLHLGSSSAISIARIAEDTGAVAPDRPARFCDVDADASTIVMDATRARAELGWKPEVSWPEGLRQLLATLDPDPAPATPRSR